MARDPFEFLWKTLFGTCINWPVSTMQIAKIIWYLVKGKGQCKLY